MSPTRPNTRCPTCKQLHASTGQCEPCARSSDRNRGTSAQRGYDAAHRTTFRAAVLNRDPLCVECGHAATVADHWPRSRRELIATGDDPNNPAHGRGLCRRCHNQHTAQAQPGGWNRR